MKKLYLVRHAKSSWRDPDLSDIDRPLKGRGTRDAYAMAHRMDKKSVRPDLIITSPAVRAISTAMIFARALNYPYHRVQVNGMAYDFNKNDIHTLIKNTNNKFDSLMVFGHDPALTNLLNLLADEQIEKIPTSGVAYIRFKGKEWNGVLEKAGRLIFLETPKRKKRKKKK